MKKNTMYMLLGAAAVIGVGFYIYNRNKSKSGGGKTSTGAGTSPQTTEPKSNFSYPVGHNLGGECLCAPASARIWSKACCQKGSVGA